MVTNESGYGHVAYVESVNGDGSWTVSEMNYRGWDQVDQRTIRPGGVPLIGFIYPPGR
jgi:surface antigen